MTLLHELHIHRLGVIEEATLRLGPGLTVASGETGAGKTLVLTALGLLTGDRADTGLVRAGEEAAIVEAVVTTSKAAADWDIVAGEETVVSREVPAEGRSRARINGRLAPAGALAELLGDSIEIHAQHEHVRLSRPDVQRRLVDAFAGDPHRRNLAEHADAWERLVAARRALATAEEDARDRARELSMLRHELAEVTAARLDADEDERLDERIELLANAEDYQEAARTIDAALGEDGAAEALAAALAALRRLPSAEGDWAQLQDRLALALEECRDVAATARDLGEAAEADPSLLSELQQRKRLVTDLCRRFGPSVADVLAFAESAASRVEVLLAGERDADQLSAELADAEKAVTATAKAVTRGRTQSAEALGKVVAGHLADLAMPHAAFRVEVSQGDVTRHGGDDVRFLLAANPGEPEAELAKAASGGERSRVSLAIEVALADVQDAQVLVFDEVDAGIGGATALAVGEKLARLARGRQVLCVTHLAQLAAFADAHHVVEKGLAGGRTVTTVREVGPDQRVEELARMLSGEPGDAGREHARELLDLAMRQRSA